MVKSADYLRVPDSTVYAASSSHERANSRNNSWYMANGVSVFLDSYYVSVVLYIMAPFRMQEFLLQQLARLPRKRGSHERTNLIHNGVSVKSNSYPIFQKYLLPETSTCENLSMHDIVIHSTICTAQHTTVESREYIVST